MLLMANPQFFSTHLQPSWQPHLWRTQLIWCACLGLVWQSSLPVVAADRADRAREFKTQLVEKILPYWYDTAVDRQNGGYVLSDDAAKKAPPATEKQLVTQSRMIWGSSHAHRKGFSRGDRNYLKAAEQGYRFLLDHFLDRQNGGYFWTTDLAGKPLNQRKIVYGESFVIYGLVEYYRASGDKAALQQALDLYHVLQSKAHDAKYGGWIEHFEADWTPMLKPGPEAIVEVGGMKSANTHLHLMEALTELYEARHDAAVRKSLEEAVRINATYFYPKVPGESCFHRHLDWKPTTEPSSAGLSYGHNVEFAWLLIRAQQVLGRKIAWDHFDAHIQHALKYGYDHQRGGLYSRGMDDQPATDTDKIWWVQSEMMAALTDGLKHKQNSAYAEALDKLVEFILKYQANPADGIWLDTVAADGTPKNTAKAHNWKANYHDVRAIVKYIEAFGGL
jgi:mannobiose 2-epimerase